MRVDRQKKLAKLRAIDISEMKGHMRAIPSTLTVAAPSPAPDAVAKPSPQSAKSTQATQATPGPNVSSDQGPPNAETITRPTTAQVQSILHAGSLNTLKIGTAVNVTLETAFWHLPEEHEFECFRPKADDDDSDEDDTTSPFQWHGKIISIDADYKCKIANPQVPSRSQTIKFPMFHVQFEDDQTVWYNLQNEAASRSKANETGRTKGLYTIPEWKICSGCNLCK